MSRGRSLCVSQAKYVAMRPTSASWVLAQLKRKLLGGFARIPRAKCTTRTAAPTTLRLKHLRTFKEVRTDASHSGKRPGCVLAGLVVAMSHGKLERKERRVVF